MSHGVKIIVHCDTNTTKLFSDEYESEKVLIETVRTTSMRKLFAFTPCDIRLFDSQFTKFNINFFKYVFILQRFVC